MNNGAILMTALTIGGIFSALFTVATILVERATGIKYDNTVIIIQLLTAHIVWAYLRARNEQEK